MAKIVPHYNPEIRVSFDVDETLIKFDGINMLKHERHIESLKQFWARGHHIRVHSAGGGAWAKEAVRLLQLDEYVHEAVAKDTWYIDDKPADEWMDRFYLKEEGFNNDKSTGDTSESERRSSAPDTIHFSTSGDGGVIYPVSQIEGIGPGSG